MSFYYPSLHFNYISYIKIRALYLLKVDMWTYLSSNMSTNRINDNVQLVCLAFFGLLLCTIELLFYAIFLYLLLTNPPIAISAFQSIVLSPKLFFFISDGAVPLSIQFSHSQHVPFHGILIFSQFAYAVMRFTTISDETVLLLFLCANCYPSSDISCSNISSRRC